MKMSETYHVCTTTVFSPHIRTKQKLTRQSVTQFSRTHNFPALPRTVVVVDVGHHHHCRAVCSTFAHTEHLHTHAHVCVAITHAHMRDTACILRRTY